MLVFVGAGTDGGAPEFMTASCCFGTQSPGTFGGANHLGGSDCTLEGAARKITLLCAGHPKISESQTTITTQLRFVHKIRHLHLTEVSTTLSASFCLAFFNAASLA
jgi:hypothetical protein